MNNQKARRLLDIAYKLAAIAAFILSIYTFNISNENAQSIAEYQISQERLPKITGLNQQLDMSIRKTSNGCVDFSYISKNIYPIQIPIYNVGVGMAQNCKIEWDEASIQNVCLQIKDLLSEKPLLHIKEFTYSQYSDFQWYDYSYLIEMEEEKITAVIHWNAENNNYVYDNVSCEIFRCPYILPLSIQDLNIYISLPNGLSTLLLEAANQNIKETYSIHLNVEYQDLSGKNYKYTYVISFLLIERTETDNDVNFIYYISFEKL